MTISSTIICIAKGEKEPKKISYNDDETIMQVVTDPFFCEEGEIVSYSNPCGEWSHLSVMEFIQFLYARYNTLICCSLNSKACLNFYESFSKGRVGCVRDAFMSYVSVGCGHSLHTKLINVLNTILMGIRMQVIYLEGNEGSEQASQFKMNYDLSDKLLLKIEKGLLMILTKETSIQLCATSSIVVCKWTKSFYQKIGIMHVSELPVCDLNRIRLFLCTGDNHSGAKYTRKAVEEDTCVVPVAFYAAIPRHIVLNIYLKGFVFAPYSCTLIFISSMLGRLETFSFINKINTTFLDRALADLLLIKKKLSDVQETRKIYSDAARSTISFIHLLLAGNMERMDFYMLVKNGLDALSNNDFFTILQESNKKKTIVPDQHLYACIHALHTLSYIFSEYSDKQHFLYSSSFRVGPMRNRFYELIYSHTEMERKKNKRNCFFIIGKGARLIDNSQANTKSFNKSCVPCKTALRKGVKAICFNKKAAKRLILIAAAYFSPNKLEVQFEYQPFFDMGISKHEGSSNILDLADIINKLSSCASSGSAHDRGDRNTQENVSEKYADIYCQKKPLRRFDDRGRLFVFTFSILAYNTNRVIFMYESNFQGIYSSENQGGKEHFVRRSFRIGKRATINMYYPSNHKIPVMINCRQSDISGLLIDKRLLSYHDNALPFEVMNSNNLKDVSVVNSNFCTNLHGVENVYCLASEFLSNGNGLKSRNFPSVTKQLVIEKEQSKTHSLKSYLSLNTEESSFCFNSTMFRSGVFLVIAPDTCIEKLINSQINSLEDICQVNPLVQQICIFNEKVNGEGMSHINSRFITTLGETMSCLGNYNQKISIFTNSKSANYFSYSDSIICNAKRHCINPSIGRLTHQSNDKMHYSCVYNDLHDIHYADDFKKMKALSESEHEFIKKIKKKHNVLSSKTTIINRSRYSPYVMNCGMNYVDCHYGLVHASQAKIAYAVYRRRLHDVIMHNFPFQRDGLLALQLPCVQFLRKKWHFELKNKL